MMKVYALHAADAHESQCLVYLLTEGQLDGKQVKAVEQQFELDLQPLFAARKFTAKKGQQLQVPVVLHGKAQTVLFVGVGKNPTVETLRRAVGAAVKTAQQVKATTISLFAAHAITLDAALITQLAVAAKLAAYRFDEFKTDEESIGMKIMELFIIADDFPMADKAIAQAELIGHAVNQTRHWIDLPPAEATPIHLADKAEAIAKKFGLKYTMFDEPTVKKMGMGGLAGVSAGSEQECRLVIMEYHVADKNAPTIALVGKGITFDSGGLSIKPAASMETMKDDMAGAAAVISAMEVIAQCKPHVNVVGITPLSENLPSGKATKPGDILRFYNGKTAEVKNTDAEGRLILADALSYAVKHYKPAAMIDVATLTGACAYALGPFFTGMMGNDADLIAHVKKSGDTVGDYVWELPFTDDYDKAITSDVADLCNIGSPKYMAGAITAGKFLKNFVGDTPWVHLDIAGTAFGVPDISYYGSGATGASVRLMIEFVCTWPTKK